MTDTPSSGARGPAPEGRAQRRAEWRAREAAERAEWTALIHRLSVLWPGYDCFCGTLDDLRNTVARLEHHADGGRPRRTGRYPQAAVARARAAAQPRGDADSQQQSRAAGDAEAPSPARGYEDGGEDP